VRARVTSEGLQQNRDKALGRGSGAKQNGETTLFIYLYEDVRRLDMVKYFVKLAGGWALGRRFASELWR
jgi:hypothetical protein